MGTASASGYDFAFSLALLGAGHLVGISVGAAMFLGLVIAWAGAVPILTALYPEPGATLEAHVSHIWTADVRLVGAGAMAVAALWTLARLAHPLVSGFARAIAASRKGGDNGRRSYRPRYVARDRSSRCRSSASSVIAVLLWMFASRRAACEPPQSRL